LNTAAFYSHGKLLLTGEYLVLDGALALALPVKYGQSLLVQERKAEELQWIAMQENGSWFEALLSLPRLEIIRATDPVIAGNLQKLLLAARSLNMDFPGIGRGLRVVTRLEFRREWGFGSSSTLIANVAGWAEVNPFELHWSVSQGSGYDIACALASGPLLYRAEGHKAVVTPVNFHPAFSESLYFAYLGHKQDSAAGIETFRKKRALQDQYLTDDITGITNAILETRNLPEFSGLINRHEEIIGKLLDRTPIGKTLFKDFPGAIKSLGAWGGDFALIASDVGPEIVKAELNKLGMKTIFTFDELVLRDKSD